MIRYPPPDRLKRQCCRGAAYPTLHPGSCRHHITGIHHAREAQAWLDGSSCLPTRSIAIEFPTITAWLAHPQNSRLASVIAGSWELSPREYRLQQPPTPQASRRLTWGDCREMPLCQNARIISI